MAEEKNKIQNILDELNHGDSTKPWVSLPGIYGLFGSKIEKESVNMNEKAIALKLFLNTKTVEVKSYIAKWLDEPEAKDLP